MRGKQIICFYLLRKDVFRMPPDKDRLYIALYARGGVATMPGLEDSYHWALHVSPKIEPEDGGKGMRFHAREKLVIAGSPPRAQTVWAYDEAAVPLQRTAMVLVRIMIGKVKDRNRLRRIFQNIPLRPDVPDWNCVGWVQEAVETAFQDGEALGSCAKSWTAVRDTAMWYIAEKRAVHRFDSQAVGRFDLKRTATWDMLKDKELNP
ncbi:hypothetical protein GGR50DRAFT_485993 [Xylaria sp. CBS 124048]|nr:hypothetical protein GGR50DRAFT_485993 [Xylaria sp. CBS 124048]